MYTFSFAIAWTIWPPGRFTSIMKQLETDGTKVKLFFERKLNVSSLLSAMYLRRVGRKELPEKEWEYYMAFNMFRLVGIVQGIMARALQGNAANRDAIETGGRARKVATAAWTMAQHA